MAADTDLDAPPSAKRHPLDMPANLLASVGTVWIFVIMCLVVADVIGRDFLNKPITGVAEFSARSVASISRSSAFISGTVRDRFARTAAWQATVASSSLRRSTSTREAPNSRMSPRTARSTAAVSRSASMAGTARTTRSFGPATLTS